MASIKLLAVILVLVFSQLAAINLPRGYASQINQIPPAIVTPKIDGKYTPVDQLNFTDIGKQAAQQDPTLMPKDEWDDSTEGKLGLENATWALNKTLRPEWYIDFKHDDKWLYAMVDAVSDTHVGSIGGKRDTRQDINFWFDKSVNETKSGCYVDFYFLQEETLQSGKLQYLVGTVPGYDVLPYKYYTYKFSIAEDPSDLRTGGSRAANSSVPHLMIEFAFDLSPLTQYSKTIRIEVSGSDVNLDVLGVGADFDLLGGQPVPEFQWSALVFPVSLLALTVLIRLAPVRSVGRKACV